MSFALWVYRMVMVLITAPVASPFWRGMTPALRVHPMMVMVMMATTTTYPPVARPFWRRTSFALRVRQQREVVVVVVVPKSTTNFF